MKRNNKTIYGSLVFMAGILGALIAMPHQAQARVFSMGKEKFGTYLRADGMMWTKNKTPFENSSGADVDFESGMNVIYGYEFGFLYAGERINWKFGFELIQPPKLQANKGTATGATTLYYTFDTELSILIPKAGFEISLKKWNETRFFAWADAGMASLTLQNSYTLTGDGIAAFNPPGADFREELKSSALAYSGALAFETLMSDTTTICLDVGYRQLKFTELKHNIDATTFQGAVVKGDPATDNDGNRRTLDLSGPFASLTFRIWVN